MSQSTMSTMRTIRNTARRAIRSATCRVVGYSVFVSGDGWSVVHLALTLREAQEWMSCYPHATTVSIRKNWTRRVVASRWPTQCVEYFALT